MHFAGQFRPIEPSAPFAPSAPLAAILQRGLDLVEDLSVKLQTLDGLLLTGRPPEISEAAAIVETTLHAATPAFAEIAQTMGHLGASNLAAAAAQLREIEEQHAAQLAESLRFALARFAKRSVSANRRARQLNRGLNAALNTLQALGVQESGRLIAEA
ncbi:MAG: hypothetical protein POH28_03340 [Acidocella sp.]|nr:hypothetical protein [Acidocella sp.]